MAGVGFRLQRMLNSQDLLNRISGSIAAVFLSSGPWLMTILTIAAISTLKLGGAPTERMIFRVLINYAYCISFLAFCCGEMITTRYIADSIYTKKTSSLLHSYQRLFTYLAIFSVVVGVGLGLIARWDDHIIFSWTILLVSIQWLWCSTLFLGACKDYYGIATAFTVGGALSIVFVYILESMFHLGIPGSILGFALGQSCTALLLTLRVIREYPYQRSRFGEFTDFVKRRPILIWASATYGISVWIDKIIYWLHPETRERVGSLLYKSTLYDSAIFLAFLSVIPGVAYFLVQVETRFYTAYRKYLAVIENRAPLTLVEIAREELNAVIRQQSVNLILFQGFFSVSLWIISEQLLVWAGLPLMSIIPYRFGLVASFFQILVVFGNILLLYFKNYRRVFLHYLIFAISNLILTLWSIRFGLFTQGLGFTLSSWLTLMCTIYSLRSFFTNLNGFHLMSQPLGISSPEKPTL